MLNPYQSPNSIQSPIPQKRPRRPISVWLLLLLLASIAALFTIGFGSYLLRAATHAGDTDVGLRAIGGIVWRLLLIAVVGGGAAGVFQGRQAGRWFGVVVLAALALVAIFSGGNVQYANGAERFGGQLGRFAIMPALMLWWGYGFGFSHKAKTYWR